MTKDESLVMNDFLPVSKRMQKPTHTESINICDKFNVMQMKTSQVLSQ